MSIERVGYARLIERFDLPALPLFSWMTDEEVGRFERLVAGGFSNPQTIS